MNKRGKSLVSSTASSSPSKSSQTSLSRYFGTTTKKPADDNNEDKKPDPPKKQEQKAKPPPPKPAPVATPERKRSRVVDSDEDDAPKQPAQRKRLRKKKDDDDDDDDEDFAPTRDESDKDEEMSDFDDSPKKKTNGTKKPKKDFDDVLSSQTSSSQSSQGSAATTATTDDGDVIVTTFKDNPKLRKEFQKKLNRILDAKENANAAPALDPVVQTTTTTKGKGKKSNLTPLEQQYVAIKKEYPDTVLLVECGYKYRFFGDDAVVANKVLKMVCYPKNNFLNASIPTQRLNFHVRRLLHAGYKVGIVKQTETAAVKKASDDKSGPFARALSALYTPATFIDDDIGNQDSDEPASSNYLLCLTETATEAAGVEKLHISLVAVSLGTGDIIYDDFEDDFMRSALETRLLHLQPKEMILPMGLLSPTTSRILMNHATNMSMRVENLDDDNFGYDSALFQVNEFYENQKQSDDDEESPVGFVLKLPKGVITCVGVLVEYLKSFQKLNQVFCLTGNFRSFSTANHMLLNGTTLTNLEILMNSSTNEEKGSLYWVMKNTTTQFGKRLLKKWITQPLVDISKIKERQDAVEEVSLGSSNTSVTALYTLLKQVPDLERIICRIHYKRCTPAEFSNALRCFKKIAAALPSLKHLHSPLLKNIVSSFPPIEQSASYFLDSISQDAAVEGNLQELFIDDTQFPAIAEGKKKVKKVEEQLAEHLKEIRKQLGKASLQYTHMPAMNLEYFIELTNAEAKKVPSSFKKVGRDTKTVQRFYTDFIIDKLQQLALHRENLTVICQQSWLAFLDEFAEKYVEFREAVQRLAVMDCICSLAVLAKNPTYIRPVFTEQQQLVIEDGRHPVVETVMADNYVPNSTSMSEDGEKCMIITGPNMGGKSSYIRQIALIIIMAQIGSYVPASSVTLSPFDAVYTRMGAQDNLEKGQSTFFVELQEASSILKQATSRSLVILDELGRGTSTHDGVAIAYATLQYLVQSLGCFSLFVTHYPLLAELEQTYSKSVANYHMSFLEEDDDSEAGAPPRVTFLFKVTRGAAQNSYGLNVARIAGIPTSILIDAAEQSKQLKETITERAFRSKDVYPRILASKLAKITSKSDSVSLESLTVMQQAAKKALQL